MIMLQFFTCLVNVLMTEVLIIIIYTTINTIDCDEVNGKNVDESLLLLLNKLVFFKSKSLYEQVVEIDRN